MDSTTIDNNIIDYEAFYEEDGSVLMAAEIPWRGFAVELQALHYLKGASFINQLKLIINSGEFFPVEGEPLSAVMQNDKRATRGDSLFENGVVSIKSCSHAETYRIVKTYAL